MLSPHLVQGLSYGKDGVGLVLVTMFARRLTKNLPSPPSSTFELASAFQCFSVLFRNVLLRKKSLCQIVCRYFRFFRTIPVPWFFVGIELGGL